MTNDPLVGGTQKAVAQDDERKQILRIYYPAEGIVLEGKGKDAVMYKGLIYVRSSLKTFVNRSRQQNRPRGVRFQDRNALYAG